MNGLLGGQNWYSLLPLLVGKLRSGVGELFWRWQPFMSFQLLWELLEEYLYLL